MSDDQNDPIGRSRATRDILIQTTRPEEARAFYENVMGLHLFSDDPGMLGFETGAFRLFVEPAPDLGPVLEFVVRDRAAAIEKLIAAGCRFAQDEGVGHNRYLCDPFGLIFNVEERDPDGHGQ